MIVHDGDTMEEARRMVALGPVRYSDRCNYVVITNVVTLVKKMTDTIEGGDVAVVVPQGQEATMEIQAAALKKIQKQRHLDELKRARQWISQHPELKGLTDELEIMRRYSNAVKADRRLKA